MRHTSAIRGFWVSPSASDSRFRALIRLRQTNPGGGPDNKDIEDIDVDEIGEIVSGPPEFVFFLSLGGLALCLQALSKAAAGNSDLGGGMLPQLGNREELLVLGLVSLLLGFQVSQWLSAYTRSQMEAAEAGTSAAQFMETAVKYGSLAVAATSLLGSAGVNIGGLTAALTSVGLAVGLASQRVLENLAAGVMLMIFRNFQIGDMIVVSGRTGIVSKITLLSTRIDTFQNVRISIPNKDMFGSIVENYSRNPMRRADVEVQTATSSDLRLVRDTLEGVTQKYAYLAEKYMAPRKRKRIGSVASDSSRPGGAVREFLSATSSSSGLTGASGDTAVSKAVSLPTVQMQDIKTYGYVWEIRVFVPTAMWEKYRCELVEDIAVSLKANGIKVVGDVIESSGLAIAC